MRIPPLPGRLSAELKARFPWLQPGPERAYWRERVQTVLATLTPPFAPGGGGKRKVRARARQLMEDGEFERAIAWCEQFARLDPRGAEAPLRLARIHLRARRFQQAAAWASKAARRDTSDAGPPRVLKMATAMQRSEALLDEAQACLTRGDLAAARTAVRHAIASAPNDSEIFRRASELMIRCVEPDVAQPYWMGTGGGAEADLALGLAIGRALDQAGRPQDILGLVASVIEAMPRFADLSPPALNRLASLMRLLMQRGHLQRVLEPYDRLYASVSQRGESDALGFWCLGLIESARGRVSAAVDCFDQGLAARPAPPAALQIDFHAEKAVLMVRHNRLAEAAALTPAIAPAVLAANRQYSGQLAIMALVSDLRGARDTPLLYPEDVIDVILEETAERPPFAYQPRPRSVAMICTCLGSGGSECQTLALLDQLTPDARVDKIPFFVRSVHLRDGDDFFLQAVRDLGLEPIVYGRDWYERSDAAKLLREFGDRPRLLRAISLLPHTYREDVIRLCRLLIDHQPEVAHIWQDIPGAALACHIVGVPRYLIRRGSLSPEYWEHTERQAQTHLRPLRHVFRRLLERSPMQILNNSVECSRTDQHWAGWDDSSRFRVVRNVIDFERFGLETRRNLELRRQLGVPDGAPVVGGAFRLVAVKRPELWVDTAALVAAQIPDVHFIITGDGPLAEEVRARVAHHGLDDRFHMPGRMANIGDWYRAMDVMLLTSDREGTPNVIIEAQHFGVPPVAADIGGISEVVDADESALLVSGQTAEDFAQAVVWALTNPSWLDRAAVRGPEFVHQMFDIGHVVDEFMDVYGFSAREGLSAAPGRLDGALLPPVGAGSTGR